MPGLNGCICNDCAEQANELAHEYLAKARKTAANAVSESLKDIPTPKEWGMFSSLSDVDANKQELRPWYHSSTLLTNLFKKGNIIVNSLTNDTSLDKTFRCLATYNEDLSLGGYAMVNQGTKKVNKSFRINKNILEDKLYIYQFGDGTYKLDEKGYIAPNYVIDGKLSDQLNLEINPCELIVVANQKL